MNDDTVIANQWPCTSGGDLGEEEKRLTSGRRQASGRALGHVGTGADSGTYVCAKIDLWFECACACE